LVKQTVTMRHKIFSNLALTGLTAALLCPQAGAFAQSSASYDLTRAFRDAKARDPQLVIASASEAASIARQDQAVAALLPNIGFAGTAARQAASTNTVDRKTFTSQTYSLSLSQPLFRPQSWQAKEQSGLAATQAGLQKVTAEQDLMVRVATAYFESLIAQANLAAARAQKTAIEEQLNVAKKSFTAGTATKIDQQESQARFDLAAAQEISAKNELDAKLTSLRILTGQAPQSLAQLPRGLELAQPLPNDAGQWLEQARKNNLQVQQAQIGTEIAKREISKQASGHLPTVDLVGSASRSKNQQLTLLGITSTNAALGLQVNAPIYSGGGVSARTREAVALHQKSDAELDAARLQAEQNTQQLFSRLNSSLALVKALETAERSSQLALDSNVLGYGVGVRVNVDVLNSQQQLFSTRRDLAKARYDFLLDGLRIKQAVGGLREDDLNEISQLLVANSLN
jgi:outer membrane protein